MVFLTGDLGFMALEPLQKALGARFINAGVAEQNMHEAAAAVLAAAAERFALPRVTAIVNPENTGSVKVLERLGMKFERMIRMSESSPEIGLYAIDLAP